MTSLADSTAVRLACLPALECVEGKAHRFLCANPRASQTCRRTASAVLALTYAAVILLARAFPLTNNVALLVAVSAPYAAVLAAVGLLLSVLSRRVVMSVIAAVVVRPPSGSKCVGITRDNRSRRVTSTSNCACCRRTSLKGAPIWRPSQPGANQC